MHLTIAYSKIKKRNLVLINNDTHQRETLSERPIRPPLSGNPGQNADFEIFIFCIMSSLWLYSAIAPLVLFCNCPISFSLCYAIACIQLPKLHVLGSWIIAHDFAYKWWQTMNYQEWARLPGWQVIIHRSIYNRGFQTFFFYSDPNFFSKMCHGPEHEQWLHQSIIGLFQKLDAHPLKKTWESQQF